MKQVLQNRKSGKPFVADVPVPVLQAGRILVRTRSSLISAGTERAAVETVSKGLVQEARERPDLVKAVVAKVRTEGLLQTVSAVREKIAASQALGYSAAGVVIEVADDTHEFVVGDRVACAGVGYASHAEVISVPRNLAARLPESITFEEGAFGTVGAIALQGVRLAQLTLNESVVVIGLGLVGQLTVQLLKANGCRVFGLDLDPARVKLALELGADRAEISNDDAATAIAAWTQGHGADAVILAAATDSNQPVELAAAVSRVKGRVVVVGTSGLNIPRQPFYLRELSLTISMSYGPGRYDPDYEERGRDYPLPYVRWTEKRNIESFLALVADRKVDVNRLTTHRFPINEAEQAYQLISGDRREPYLGVTLNYNADHEIRRQVELQAPRVGKSDSISLGVIGAGAYVRAMLLPHFKTAGVEFRSVSTASGVSAVDVGKNFGFDLAVSGGTEILDDERINLVVIGTRHDQHAELTRAALERNKNVFVEKPLALNDNELDHVLGAAQRSTARLMVGFNRRFSPLATKAKEFFADLGAPLSIVYRVNAGRIPQEHWTQNPSEGGGRIVGEVCHFIDLMQFLTGAAPTSVFAETVESKSELTVDRDSVMITLKFADGSNGVIAYLSEGDKALAKERVEIFGGGRSFVLDDFRKATLYRNGREEQVSLRSQDKGQRGEVAALCASILEGTKSPMSLAEIAVTTRATFRILDSLRTHQPIDIESSLME